MTYRNMTARQLRKVAPAIGLTGASRKTKDEIVSWIDQNMGLSMTQDQLALLGVTPEETVEAPVKTEKKDVVTVKKTRWRLRGKPADTGPATDTVPNPQARVTYDPGGAMSNDDRRSRRALPRFQRRHSVTVIRPLAHTPPIHVITNLPRSARRPGAMVPLVLNGQPWADRGYESGGDRRARRAAAVR